MEIISAHRLSFSYGSDFSLSEISLSVGEGEVVSLLGPNGSGKTTLLRCMNSLVIPPPATVFVKSKDILTYPQNELAKKIGYVPQSHNPSFPFTVFDAVLMGRASHLSIFQLPSRHDEEVAELSLKMVGIYHLKDRAYTQISGGEKQLVLIARALAQEPEALLLDEPTAHLDFRNQVSVLKVIRKLGRERNLAVLMSLHEPNLALLFSDKVAIMNGGRIAAFGEAKSVVTKENIEKNYGIEVESVQKGGISYLVPKV